MMTLHAIDVFQDFPPAGLDHLAAHGRPRRSAVCPGLILCPPDGRRGHGAYAESRWYAPRRWPARMSAKECCMFIGGGLLLVILVILLLVILF